MDTEDLRLAHLGGDGDNDSLDNLPPIKSHRSVGKNLVFSTPPSYTNGRFSAQGKQSRFSSVGNKSGSSGDTKSLPPVQNGDPTAEVYDPETGTKKKLNNNFVGVASGKNLKMCLCIGMAVLLLLLFIAFVVYTAIRLQNEKCPDDYICWGENE